MIASYLSNDDYPVEALRNGWEGDVVIKLHVGVDGRAHSCRIVTSSGYPLLDNQTCYLMLVRARFAPAKDEDGKPMEDDVLLPPIKWRL